jgi:putative CocE/NonD family hydrolase
MMRLFPVAGPGTGEMRTRDGVRLVADIWRPEAPGRFPVLLMRQPYGRRIASTVAYAHPAFYAARGFVVVVQDVRGTGGSGGAFLAYANEAEDGADAIAWAASLPQGNGRVGMYGFSYQGAAQTLALSQAPPALGAIAPAMAIWDLRGERAGERFALAGNASWAAQVGAIRARHAGDAAAYAELAAASNAMRFDGVVPADPEVLRRHASLHHFALWRDAPPGDAYWQRASSAARMAGCAARVPAFFTGGWFDYHLAGTVAGFRALAGTSHLLIGPWVHLQWAPRGAGADFGPAAQSDVDSMQAGFFAHALADADPPPWMAEARVLLFDLTRRAWRLFDSWPEPPPRVLHLAGDGLAAVREDGGRLQDAPPSALHHERFVHDPWRPAPSFGLHHGGGFADRSAVDARFDIACFTTAPFVAPLPLAGTPRAEIAVEAEAASFDLHATLSLLLPDGRALPVSDGMARAASAGVLSIPLRPLCLTVEPGHRLRLSLAGASFPAHAMNPGTGADPLRATAAEAVPISYAIACGGAAPSRLLLPAG